MRTYFKLLRLPYQLQLGPIFAWGFFLSGGTFRTNAEIARFVAVFLIFHIGAFGGMTALNSFYDRDETPVGGMWSPPKVPLFLWHFAWIIQIGGLILLLPFGAALCLIYTGLLVLSLLYSHPLSRGKAHPWRSLVIVAVGQGVLDCFAGAFAASAFATSAFATSAFAASSTRLGSAFCWGTLGATLTVAAFYPLTQLYQIEEDKARGDRTLALWLANRGGRNRVFNWSLRLSALAIFCNAFALWKLGSLFDAGLLCAFGTVSLLFIARWKSSTRTVRDDFQRVHFLMRAQALVLACYLLWRFFAH